MFSRVQFCRLCCLPVWISKFTIFLVLVYLGTHNTFCVLQPKASSSRSVSCWISFIIWWCCYISLITTWSYIPFYNSGVVAYSRGVVGLFTDILTCRFLSRRFLSLLAVEKYSCKEVMHMFPWARYHFSYIWKDLLFNIYR